MIMWRTLRSGTRQDYKKMVNEKSEHESDADEQSDGLIAEGKLESNNDDQHQLLDTIPFYQNTQNQQKLMHIGQENGRKPHLGPFLALNGPF